MQQPAHFLASTDVVVTLAKLGLALVAGLIGLIAQLFTGSEVKKRWPRVARRLGLAFQDESIVGQRGAAQVSVSLDVRRSRYTHQNWTVVRFTGARLPARLGLAVASEEALRTARRDLERGDTDFDKTVAVRGQAAWRAMLLSDSERARIARAVADGWRLDGGALRRDERGVATGEIESLLAEGEALIAILAERDDDVVRLADLARSGSPESRAAAFDPHGRGLPRSPRDGRARRGAAPRRGPGGGAPRRLHPGRPAHAGGLRNLGRDRAGAAPPGHRRAGAPTPRRRWPSAPWRASSPPARPPRSPRRSPPRWPTCATPRPSRCWSPCWRAKRARRSRPRSRSLGCVGTIAAVAPLLTLRHTAHGPRARVAVQAIRERAGNPDAGRLSLAAAEGGELALA
ncbi:MAG: hypothetical protein U1F43_24435 [Myxococcota bacterium]